MSAGAVFIICQGRAGGTIFADLVAELCAPSRLYLEPWNLGLRPYVEENREGSPPSLRHRVRPHPWADYRSLPGLRQFWGMNGQQRVDHLVRHSDRRPVIKLCRAWGVLRKLHDTVPGSTFLHLCRGFDDQEASRRASGISAGEFGELRAYNLRPREMEKAHAMANAEARAVCDLSVSYEGLMAEPKRVLREVARLIGGKVWLAEDLAHRVTRRTR